MSIGLPELIVIVIIILALFDPDKLKEISAKLGKATAAAVNATKDVNAEVVEPIQEDVVQPLKEAVQPLTDLRDQVSDVINSTTKTGGK